MVRLRKMMAVLFGAMMIWVGIRVAVQTFVLDRDRLLYETRFARLEEESAFLTGLFCDQSAVDLASYPNGTYHYWFTGMRPVSRYVFMYPWVAEVGLAEVIDALDQEQAMAFVVIREHRRLSERLKP